MTHFVQDVPNFFGNLVGCKRDHFHAIIQNCGNKVEIQSPLSDGYTLLHIAVYRRDMEAVAALVSQSGCDPHQKYERPVQHLTAFQLASLLLFPAAELMYQQCPPTDMQPIERAVLDGNLEAVKDCLMRNPSHRGLSLLFACGKGDLSMVELLALTPTTRPGDTSSPSTQQQPQQLHHGARAPLQGGARNMTFTSPWNGQHEAVLGLHDIHCAAANGQLSVVQWLLNQHRQSDTCNTATAACGPQMDAQNGPVDRQGKSALWWAAWGGHVKVVEWLVREAECSPSTPDIQNNTPLMVAAARGHLEVVKWLITKGGVNGGTRGPFGKTVLLVSAEKGHLPIVQWLLNKNHSHLTETTSYKDTALLLATAQGHFPVVQWLVQHGGGSVRDRDAFGTSVVGFAARSGNLQLLQWLITETEAIGTIPYCKEKKRSEEEGNSSSNANQQAGDRNKEQTIPRFWPPPACTKRIIGGASPLLEAVLCGHQHVVDWVLENDYGSITERDDDGRTAAVRAASKGELQLLKHLHAHWRADLSADDDENKTIAIHAVRGGHLTTLEWVLNQPGVPYTNTPGIDSPLHSAVQAGYAQIVDWILHEGWDSVDTAISASFVQREEAIKRWGLSVFFQQWTFQDHANFPEAFKRCVQCLLWIHKCRADVAKHRLPPELVALVLGFSRSDAWLCTQGWHPQHKSQISEQPTATTP
eukprot:TRINITY_DN67666_c10_g3_i1.p1 TRINITY_DN67666_c10_g3~~TRINITY_DN67666_c10_g3_i1.p1  ORF type:complete len:699 (-),score=51.31 TRINITY_DN67666_c10_g3_i1:257-2353(-)